MRTLRYLLDTNVVSEGARPRPSRGVMDRLAQERHRVAVCAPVWHELHYGLERLPDSHRRRALSSYVNEVVGRLPILPYDDAAALWHATERARLDAAGATRPFVDGQIAAVAATNELTLVTGNVGDFDAFANLDVEDWTRRARDQAAAARKREL